MIEKFRKRYTEIILAILNRISCVIYSQEVEDFFEDVELRNVPLNISHDNPIIKYMSIACLKSPDDPLREFITGYGTQTMFDVQKGVEEYYEGADGGALAIHDCAVDVAIERARLDTFLEVFSELGSELEPDYKILLDWMQINPTIIGEEDWS